MIIINSTLKGENTYEITVFEGIIYRVSAFTLEDAINLMADYIEHHDSKSVYIDKYTLALMAECSPYKSVEAYAKAYNLTPCGTNNIYLEITNIKEVSA